MVRNIQEQSAYDKRIAEIRTRLEQIDSVLYPAFEIGPPRAAAGTFPYNHATLFELEELAKERERMINEAAYL